MIALILGCLIILLLFYYTLDDLYCIYWKGQPAGPLSLPLIGGLYKFDRTQMPKVLEGLARQYGPICSIRMGPMGRAIILNDIKLVHKITENIHMNDRPEVPAFNIVDTGGDGIGSCAYNKRWMTMTKLFNRGLSRIGQTSVCQTTDTVVDLLLDRFNKIQNTPYNPRKDLQKAMSNLLNHLIYGQELVDCLDNPVLKHGMLRQETIIPILGPTHPGNLVPGYWKLAKQEKAQVDKVLKERDNGLLQTLSEKVDNFSGTIWDMMDVVAEFTLNSKATTIRDTQVTTKDMLSSVWAIYLAGLDTTVDTLLWFMYNLCIFTEVQEKIFKEIASLDEDDLLLENRNQLNYTRAAILESLRLSTTIAMGIPHLATKDTVLAGYNIEKGQTIMLNQHFIHHNEELWDDPYTLKPERFLNTDGKTVSSRELKEMPFVAFSSGRRTCIGQYMVLDVLLIFAAKMFRRYRIRFPDGYVPNNQGQLVLNLQPDPFDIIIQAK